MAKKPSFDRETHREHALSKASATHLLNAGHIDRDQHREIVKDAEKGMRAAKGAHRERD